jgi:predicted ATPase
VPFVGLTGIFSYNEKIVEANLRHATKTRRRAMIESIEFSNYKALRNATLPLAPFTLLLGPNGSGKTTVLQSLEMMTTIPYSSPNGAAEIRSSPGRWGSLQSVTTGDPSAAVEAKVSVRLQKQLITATFQWYPDGRFTRTLANEDGNHVEPTTAATAVNWLDRMKMFSLDASAMAQPVTVNANPLQRNGSGLAAVLDNLKDNEPERWETLLAEMRRWLPEYDHILFDKPSEGNKRVLLRTKRGGHRIPANEVSQGTLLSLGLLTLAYSPNPPSVIGLEEIDRGLHPRLLRHLQDALYRLTYPDSCGESRPPIQVIATTHSPYLLDLYRDHPEEVVLAQKEGLEVNFKRLADIDHFGEILGDSPLSEVWYSGVLGGVSVKP